MDNPTPNARLIGARHAFYWDIGDVTLVRVMCPKCSSTAYSSISSAHSKCIICDVLMSPCDDTKIVCRWDDAIKYKTKHSYYDNDIINDDHVDHVDDFIEIGFIRDIPAIHINREDVIHLANQFGLVVFEPGSQL